MTNWQRPQWRKLPIPLRNIDAVYGRDSYDNAGDDLIYFLRSVSEYPNKYRYRFAIDITHTDSWYHVMEFEIEGMSDGAYERLVEKVVAAGLFDSAKT
ncbi:hypothetical protein NG895_15865 [Aeoliella sp. ICT_H6.2]|uniref:Uncharacterized protein n=1 Tax=Aeoliella straminimaris TaxID=2954799 RepID=A0A9X2JH34_9BACT|nr:hypothetical protein [Aeoliella straminimaris]MCO6045386.1 hypothetical protein [Aeoliella straminimaris]